MALLLASLFFYAWGETIYVVLMLFSITTNYFYGLWIHNAQQKDKSGKPIVVLSIITNFGMLAFFKYANFFVYNLNIFLSFIGIVPVSLSSIHLPIGISFFTFQAISYIIDLYRKDATVQKNPINIALYISLFPQLIAGPIIRYHDVAKQIMTRSTRVDDFAYGIKTVHYRFREKSIDCQYRRKSGRSCFFAIPSYSSCPSRMARHHFLYDSDLFRLFRIFGYGDRFGANVWISFSRKF